MQNAPTVPPPARTRKRVSVPNAGFLHVLCPQVEGAAAPTTGRAALLVSAAEIAPVIGDFAKAENSAGRAVPLEEVQMTLLHLAAGAHRFMLPSLLSTRCIPRHNCTPCPASSKVNWPLPNLILFPVALMHTPLQHCPRIVFHLGPSPQKQPPRSSSLAHPHSPPPLAPTPRRGCGRTCAGRGTMRPCGRRRLRCRRRSRRAGPGATTATARRGSAPPVLRERGTRREKERREEIRPAPYRAA